MAPLLGGASFGDIDQHQHDYPAAVRPGEGRLAHQHPAAVAADGVAVLVFNRLVSTQRARVGVLVVGGVLR